MMAAAATRLQVYAETRAFSVCNEYSLFRPLCLYCRRNRSVYSEIIGQSLCGTAQ